MSITFLFLRFVFISSVESGVKSGLLIISVDRFKDFAVVDHDLGFARSFPFHEFYCLLELF